MSRAAASSLRQLLADVATGGTARRLAGAFTDGKGAVIAVGGKTGSGDNRHKTFARGGGVISSRPESRTATFTFYIGDRHVGVITASVLGKKAGSFHFTSALPVAVLRLLAPAIASRHRPDASARGVQTVCALSTVTGCGPDRDPMGPAAHARHVPDLLARRFGDSGGRLRGKSAPGMEEESAGLLAAVGGS